MIVDRLRPTLQARCGGIGLVVLALLVVGCRREERRFTEAAFMSVTGTRGDEKKDSGLAQRAPLPAPSDQGPYAGNAWAIGAGQRLYAEMNCVGCHSHGGGGVGLPLMDGKWAYGGEPGAIYQSIARGRVNGMPPYEDKLSDPQIWQLVAYVRSLSGLAPGQAAPVRDDHMSFRPPPSRTEPPPQTHQDNP